MSDQKEILRRYLEAGFEALRWKIDGLDDYHVRRPLVPTGTNLLGLAKHLSYVTAGYFGPVFDRVSEVPLDPGDEPNADMWATAEESRAEILARLDAAAAEAMATIDSLDLDAPGRVSWWGDHGAVTLHQILVHMIAELHRHVGHADIIRELIDGAAGVRPGSTNLPGDSEGADAAWWVAHHAQVQATADRFR
ncbi:DinB family protein [Nocardioides limicola]|uniref:DinB family protein n=1 Tax=Nocardioides limicola TaxID=2803368 RepID=UPI00193BDB38|nr:DinB family protein [Nocardioides sp. DJM-14]